MSRAKEHPEMTYVNVDPFAIRLCSSISCFETVLEKSWIVGRTSWRCNTSRLSFRMGKGDRFPCKNINLSNSWSKKKQFDTLFILRCCSLRESIKLIWKAYCSQTGFHIAVSLPLVRMVSWSIGWLPYFQKSQSSESLAYGDYFEFSVI